ncbi:cytochrome C oxidase subunit IV family protein [Colwelliaceae bacterium 6441]
MDYSIPVNLYNLASYRAMNNKQIIISWLSLIALTLLSIYVGDFFDNHNIFILLVLFIVFLKGQQIVDIFMELKTAPSMWRLLLISYVLLIPAIISIIYIIE